MQVAAPDGVLTRSGGKVVKNVAGYDLHRLHPGAGGGLGIIVEATLRLEPRPEAEASLKLVCEGESGALGAWRWLRIEGPEVGVLRFERGADGSFIFVADIIGDREVVSTTVTALENAWGRWGRCEASPQTAAGSLPEGITLSQFGLLMRLNLPPDEVLSICGRFRDRVGADEGEVRIWAYPNLGEIRLGFAADAARTEEMVEEIADGARAGKWSYRVLSQASGTPFAPPAFSGTGPQFRLLARLKEAFDPQGLLRPGAFTRESLERAASFFENKGGGIA
jgi:glycolate oxidase FAD binding subunit